MKSAFDVQNASFYKLYTVRMLKSRTIQVAVFISLPAVISTMLRKWFRWLFFVSGWNPCYKCPFGEPD